MPFLLRSNTAEHGLSNHLIGRVRSQEWLDVGFVMTEQAIAKTSVRGQTESIATTTERLTHTGNQPNSTFAIREFKILCRSMSDRISLWQQVHRIAARMTIGRTRRIDGSQCPELRFQPRNNLMSKQDLVALPLAVGIEWHEFDKSHDSICFASQLAKRNNLILSQSSYRNRVEFDR